MASATFLLGGGWDEGALRAHLGAFLDACPNGPTDHIAGPVVTCVVVDEGDGSVQAERYAEALRAAGPCDPRPVLIALGSRLDMEDLADADGLLVCGGLTPAYAEALCGVSDALRSWLADGGRPYAGFSAGSAVAARSAVVGGWRLGGVPVCSEDAGEDLDELAVVDGLGLVPFAVDVHCAQWGTLSRAVAAVHTTPGLTAVAIDEDTMVTVRGATMTVSGRGHAWVVASAGATVDIRMHRGGDQVALPA